MIQPHKNLKELIIKGYGGIQFSSWVGDCSFSKMTVLKLEDNEKCTSLPSLGLLDSLKNLTIKGMKGIKNIGSEFYGKDCLNPFRSLETLSFQDKEEWEHWDPMKGNEGVESFPNLRELSIVQCPKLSGILPNNLSLLEKLVIRRCGELVVSLLGTPSLCKLEIDECKKIVYNSPDGSNSLSSLSLSHVSDFSDWLTHDFQRVEVLWIVDCDELINLWQKECFVKKPPQGFHSLICLRELSITACNSLTTLIEGIKHNNSCLEKLRVDNCSSLTFLFRGQLPPSLKSLSIGGCKNLQCLLEDDKDCSCSSKENVKLSTSHVEDQHTEEGPSLTCPLSTNQLSPALTFLYIGGCSKLTTLSSTGSLPITLKHLQIRFCSELTTLLPKGQLPERLETLYVESCPKLESIVERFHNNRALERFYIFCCDNLKFIPGGLHTLSCLRYITIDDCGGLVSFPEYGLPNSISSVCIRGSPMSFPEGGFPTSLTWLEISGIKLYKPLMEWGLDNLTSLTHLTISGCMNDGSFPIEDEEMAITLPSALTSLSIENFPNLKYFSSKYFQNLISLKNLEIESCPNLASLPNLPPSLLKLYIKECNLLKLECKRDEGKEWSKIADIPRVQIDNKFIYDP